MPPHSQKESEALAFLKEANLAYFFHDRLSPVMKEMTGIDSLSEKRANYVCAELLEAFLWVHLGLRVNYFPIELSRRLTYEHMHFFLRAYERILAARLMESWFGSPFRSIWESEWTPQPDHRDSSCIGVILVFLKFWITCVHFVGRTRTSGRC